jgi:hypothetical protein
MSLPANARKVGSEHDFGGALVATQVYQDPSQADPNKAFNIEIKAAGKTYDEQLTNGQIVSIPLAGITLDNIVSPVLNFEITDFNLGPGAPGTRKLAFNIRVRVRAIFFIQVALIPVSAQV